MDYVNATRTRFSRREQCKNDVMTDDIMLIGLEFEILNSEDGGASTGTGTADSFNYRLTQESSLALAELMGKTTLLFEPYSL